MDRMLAHLVERKQTDVVLTTYNFAMRSVAASGQDARPTDMTAAIQAARRAGMGIVVMKAMAGGVARVGRGEAWLRRRGFSRVRLRVQGDRARLELAPYEWAAFLAPAVRRPFTAFLRGLGFGELSLEEAG